MSVLLASTISRDKILEHDCGWFHCVFLRSVPYQHTTYYIPFCLWIWCKMPYTTFPSTFSSLSSRLASLVMWLDMDTVLVSDLLFVLVTCFMCLGNFWTRVTRIIRNSFRMPYWAMKIVCDWTLVTLYGLGVRCIRLVYSFWADVLAESDANSACCMRSMCTSSPASICGSQRALLSYWLLYLFLFRCHKSSWWCLNETYEFQQSLADLSRLGLSWNFRSSFS